MMDQFEHKCGCGQAMTGLGMEFYECEAYPRCLGGQATYYFMRRDHNKQAVRFVKESATWEPIQRVRMSRWLTINLEKLKTFKEKAWR